MSSSTNKARILVIGAGVSGLTTALCLRQKGFQITIVAEKLAPHIVSVVAGALWEWPPAVCGFHLDPRSLERSKQWCMTSYEKFFELSADDHTGIFIRPVNFYFRYEVMTNPQARHKMEEIQSHVLGFRHDPSLITEHPINSHIGLKDAYRHLAPMIDTDAYMNWLFTQVQEAGCAVVLDERINGDLTEQEQALKHKYCTQAIVNCSGLGARELARDDMYPLRGALIRVKNDGSSMPRITQAYCVPHETGDEQDLVFIVPRGKDMLVLGGLTEPYEWSKDITLENYRPIQEMLRRCVEFLPILKQAQFDQETVRVGLRPLRNNNVRLEQEPGTSIFHNYGHGGSGVTFSWGCAQEIVDTIETTLY